MYQPSSRRPSLVVNCTSLVGGAEIGGRDVGAGGVGDDVRDRDGEQDGEREEQRADRQQQPPRVAPPEAVVAAT